MRRPMLAAVFTCCLLAGACRAFPGHPVRLSQPRLSAPSTVTRAPAPEPPGIADAEAAATLFHGLEGVLVPLLELRRLPLPQVDRPRFLRLTRMESSVRRRYRRGGFGGAVRSVVVLAVTGTMPLRPREAADLITDPGVERAALAADALWPLQTVYALPGADRARYRAHLLGRGAGPLRYDLRFSFAAERRETRDGRVFLRFDPDLHPRPEHVTLFRGGCLLEPTSAGARVTEILILGTDLYLLPPLQGELMKLVLETMRSRATHIWDRAWGRR